MIRKYNLTPEEAAYNEKLLDIQKIELRIAAYERKLKRDLDPDTSAWDEIWEKRLGLEETITERRRELIEIRDSLRRSRHNK